jgi:phospholipid/cholesterol/gamma-HCH transport system ATP-binding protein
MRKRAGLARALALEPAILLADEPSAGLDPITAAEIDALFVGLRESAGTTLLVVTHHIQSARTIGEEFTFLHEGRILARGAPDALAASDIPLVRQFMSAEGGG